MVEVVYEKRFQKKYDKIKDQGFKEQVKKQIQKIINNPDIGKPMMYDRRGTREVYVSHFRLSYAFADETIYLLDLYHKDEQ